MAQYFQLAAKSMPSFRTGNLNRDLICAFAIYTLRCYKSNCSTRDEQKGLRLQLRCTRSSVACVRDDLIEMECLEKKEIVANRLNCSIAFHSHAVFGFFLFYSCKIFMLNSIIRLLFFGIRIDYAIAWFRYNVGYNHHSRIHFAEQIFHFFDFSLFISIICSQAESSALAVPSGPVLPYALCRHTFHTSHHERVCTSVGDADNGTTGSRESLLRPIVLLLRSAHVLAFSFTEFDFFHFPFSIVDRKIHFSHSPQLKFAFRCCATTAPNAPVSFSFPFVVVVDDFRDFSSLLHFFFFQHECRAACNGMHYTTRMRIQFSSL